MNEEGWVCPLSSRSQQLRLQNARRKGTLDYHHQTPSATRVTKAQRGEGTGPRSHSELVGGLGLEPRMPDSTQSSFHPTRDPAMPAQTLEARFTPGQAGLACDLGPGCPEQCQSGHLLVRMLGIAREAVGLWFVWNQPCTTARPAGS